MSDRCRSSEKNDVPSSAPAATAAKPACPHCGRAGRPVSTLTLKHQVRADFLTAVDDGVFLFCPTPECPVVYFAVGGLTLTTSDVRRPVTQKDPVHAPLCHCFGFTTAMVREEIEATGKSTVIERIAAEMKSDFCACEIRNPQGSCCLGNVKAAVKAAHAVDEDLAVRGLYSHFPSGEDSRASSPVSAFGRPKVLL
jgi:hypothetical protein